MSEFVRRVKRPVKPLSARLSRLDLELTERCNSRCIHCYINQPEDDPILKAREMDTGDVQSILKQAADLGCLSVRFTGGEPLLREDFVDLYQFTRKLGIKALISTNARLITPELARLFARIPPREPIEVSVYGMRAESYDAVAGLPGAFDEFRRGIALLQERRVPFVVRQSLLPQNRGEQSEFEAFAKTLPHMDGKPGYSLNFDLRARRDDEAKNRRIRRLRSTPEETLAFLTQEPEKYIKSSNEFAAKFMGPPGSTLFRCGAGLGVCVDSYGNAQMCMLLRHPDTVYPLMSGLGQDMKQETELSPLEHALSVFFPGVRRMEAENPEYLRRCAVCFLKGFCEQCPAKSWEEHGTLDTPVEYLCDIAHAQAGWLGWLKDGEKSWTVREWKSRIR